MAPSIRGPKKILLRSPNWVGDAVMATPVATALKKTFPHAEVHVLARPWVALLWENHSSVDRIIMMEKKGGLFAWFKTVLQLRRGAYDLTILLTPAFSAAWLAFFSDIPKRVGFATDGRRWLLTHPVSWAKSMAHIARPKSYLTLARTAGADIDLCNPWDFMVKVTPKEIEAAVAIMDGIRDKWVGLAPGSVAASRRWPVKRYAQLADRLAEAGWRVALVGSPSDLAIAQQVARQTKQKPLILAGKTDLRVGLAVIRQLQLLISNDSGAMHMAYAQGVPVLVLQGAADPQVTGPFGKNSAYLRDNTLACAPCVKNECLYKEIKCMQNISVQQVWEKTTAMLEQSGKKA